MTLPLDSDRWIAYAILDGPQKSSYQRASNDPLTGVAGSFIDMGSSDAEAELGVFLVQEQK
ncbi:uncharacterized protein EKO05_0004674 [Ascochyta rabiei]|uniref:uncharacterized protein n=1 Tax=Didymella rabiei TaxID=5454 RepID=UPI002201A6AA|nr:uncharacterized protein EKO05_0004674 [Ascochyta rabiei]UPX14184.1 hypothetical protein EKO05_0004674 [Ascochyta rabiei]